MARIAAVEGLRPRDLVGGWVQIDDYACHVQAAYGSRGVEFALMLDERSPVDAPVHAPESAAERLAAPAGGPGHPRRSAGDTGDSGGLQ